MKPLTMYRRVVIEADLDDVECGKRATAAVLHALRDRLTRVEGAHALAQLPQELKELWAPLDAPRRPVKMHKAAFYERVRMEARLASIRDARAATTAVFAALKQQISCGECDDIGRAPRRVEDDLGILIVSGAVPRHPRSQVCEPAGICHGDEECGSGFL